MKTILPRTIQARLILSHLLVSIVSIALVSIYSGNILFNVIRRQVEQEYENLAMVLASDLEKPMSDFSAGDLTISDIEVVVSQFLEDESGVRYSLYLPDGEPLLDYSGALPPAISSTTHPELWRAVEEGFSESTQVRLSENRGETIFVPVKHVTDERLIGILRLDIPLQLALNSSRQSLGLLIAAALLIGLGMSAVGYASSRSLAGQIESIMRTAESLSRGELSARVKAPESPYEMNRLAEAFNNMASRLQSHVNELRAFVANASHELRTPLTSIKLRVEALRDGALDDPPVAEQFLADVESEVDRLIHMVNDLLDLSRIEAGLDVKKQVPIDLAVITSEVYETFKARAERAGVVLGSRVIPGLPEVMGNEDQLRRMLYNLVDNAIKYTSRGGSVDLFLQPGKTGNTVILSVQDTGFGIAAPQLPHIFERFYRVEATRPRFGPPQGSGLGLPIAKSIAESHGGQIGVTSQLGRGSTFWVELPTCKKYEPT